MNKQLLARIEELFRARLSTKTGWGRNDVLDEYRAAVSEAILELLDSQDKS